MPWSPPVHGAARRKRNAPPDPFYTSTRWRKLRRQLLQRSPLCADIFRDHGGLPVPATVADHIVPRRDAPDLELDLDNLRALCAACHGRLGTLGRVRHG